MNLKQACIQVLRDNDRGRTTVPSPHLYPHQWAWDSAFAAIGWAHFDKARAVLELTSLIEGRWSDGRVPHIQFDPKASGYWPGPDFWGTERSTSITQPPVWASAARRLVELGVDPADLAPLLPGMDASHAWFAGPRDPYGLGLVAVAHPWESGRDNCPAWDGGMSDVDPSQSPTFERRDTQHVDDPAERPTDDTYRRYAVLVKAIEADSFGPGPFCVYDPMMTALLVRADLDLAHLAEAAGQPELAARAAERAEKMQSSLLERLWRPELGRFGFLARRAGQQDLEAFNPDVLAAFLPLVLDLPPDVTAACKACLRSAYWTDWPLPTHAPNAETYEPRRYWRGPTWTNMNWLLVPALGEDLAKKTIQLTEQAGFREYFDARTGDGLGADQFTWTAALTLDLLERGF